MVSRPNIPIVAFLRSFVLSSQGKLGPMNVDLVVQKSTWIREALDITRDTRSIYLGKSIFSVANFVSEEITLAYQWRETARSTPDIRGSPRIP